jgi:hypothetical protein
LNNVNGKNLTLELIDLYENDEPSGTLVIMKIPI